MMEDHGHSIRIRYNIPLAREIVPIYKNPCKKCLIQACCTRPCRDRAVYETTSYWRRVKIQHIIYTTLIIALPVLVIAATIWTFK